MRKGNDPKILTNDQGQLVAVALGADHCAEHEWGIAGLQREFGFGDLEKFGLERRKITRVSPHLRWVEFKINVYRDMKNKSVSMAGFWAKPWTEGHNPTTLDGYFAGTLWTGWSEGDFGIFSYDADEVAKLRELYERMLELDVAIWLGGGGVFQNAGLVIGVARRLSIEVVSKWETADRERAELKKDARATGIEERLTKAGLKWFALSPRRKPDGSLVWWLNPQQQNLYNSCLATLQDLEAWIVGKGPIVKKKKPNRRFRWA